RSFQMETVMRRTLDSLEIAIELRDIEDRFDLDALLHPSGAFAHPMDVVSDPDLTLSEMRAILSSWAAEACGMDDAQGAPRARSRWAVAFDDIVDALHEVDRRAAAAERPRPPQFLNRRMQSRARPSVLGRKLRPSGDEGPTLN